VNLTVHLPDNLAQEVRDADLPVSTICQKALREALHGATDPLERIAADQARIREALGIEVADHQSHAKTRSTLRRRSC
jgi:post-segregation antitoxin (ccd killing protein)